MFFHVEFYGRVTGHLEHNDTYSSLDEAFTDAHGRLVIVAAVTESEEWPVNETACEESR